MPDLQQLRDAIIRGDAQAAANIAREALSAGSDPVELVQRYMVPAMDEVGRRFECQDYFVPELLLSARAMKKALELIRPLLAEQGAPSAGRVIIGTVKGDLHDIGKNLVASMLEGAGFEAGCPHGLQKGSRAAGAFLWKNWKSRRWMAANT